MSIGSEAVAKVPKGREVKLAGLVAGHRRLADQLFGDLDEEAYAAAHAVLADVAGRLQALVAEEGS